MIRELVIARIENYSRYLDGRLPGQDLCLLDYFPKDYLMVVDEVNLRHFQS
jgi:excinuclease ABC subunit B